MVISSATWLRIIGFFLLSTLLISCRGVKDDLGSIPTGLYTSAGTSAMIYVTDSAMVFVDPASVAGDTVVTVVDYSRKNDRIIELTNREIGFSSINVIETMADHTCDSIEVNILFPALSSTSGIVKLNFTDEDSAGGAGENGYEYEIYYDPTDSFEKSLKIPQFDSDSPIFVESVFIPSARKTFAPDGSHYYGLVNYFADPYWNVTDRSNAVFAPSDRLSRLDIIIGYTEADLARPVFMNRPAIVEKCAEKDCTINLDGMKFTKPMHVSDSGAIIKLAKEALK